MDAVLEPGDIQLLNNHTVLHARTAFVDYEVLRLGCKLLPAASGKRGMQTHPWCPLCIVDCVTGLWQESDEHMRDQRRHRAHEQHRRCVCWNHSVDT